MLRSTCSGKVITSKMAPLLSLFPFWTLMLQCIFIMLLQLEIAAVGGSEPKMDPTTKGYEPLSGAQYRLLNESGSFELIDRQRGNNTWPDNDLIRLSQGEDRPHAGLWTFNWVARRDPVILVSGDLPRIAMMRTFRVADLNPSFVVMGDLRVRIRYGGKNHWLDEMDHPKTHFFPWGTIHQFAATEIFPFIIEIVSTLTNRGICVQLSIVYHQIQGMANNDANIDLFYGGVVCKDPILQAAYIISETNDAENNELEVKPHGCKISASLDLTSPLYKAQGPTPITVEIKAEPLGSVEISTSDESDGMGNRLVFHHQIKPRSKPYEFRMLAYQIESANLPDQDSLPVLEKFSEYCEEARTYFDSLLDKARLRSPDPYLNSAFHAAVVNLDYAYQPPAWLEGLHKWNSYIVNNYQISAAIALGQLERARNALIFLGESVDGPCPNRMADGSIFTTGNHGFEEGLPYYILQLHRYWRATDDTVTLNQLWEKTVNSLEKMCKVRDPEGNLLMNWHQGCNMFLYQADHLSLPGDAFTPSTMIAHNLVMMAEMALARGERQKAEDWHHRAAYMQSEILRRFWSPDDGKFIAGIDTQGMRMKANYYTDYVFPQLYSNLPAIQSWVCLKTLDRTLWLDDHLMRTGDYKPPLFGNDQVHPVQMAEAAEAYFRAGRPERGLALLHGTALAVTVLTDSPGSFPERLSDTGFGQPDYGFANPAGAYVQSVVSGLFGFVRVNSKMPIEWQPSIPTTWQSAQLRVGDITMQIQGTHGDRTYILELSGHPQSLNARLPLHGHIPESITDQRGQDLNWILEAHPSGGYIRANLNPARIHKIHLISRAPEKNVMLPSHITPGSMVKWRLPEQDMKVEDPQEIFSDFRVNDVTLEGQLTHGMGPRTLFLVSHSRDRVIPHDMEFDPPAAIASSMVLEGVREHYSLSPCFNSDSVNRYNFWGGGPIKIDLTNVVQSDSPEGNLAVGRYKFQVPTGWPNVIMLEIGNLEMYDLRIGTPLSGKPFNLSLPVGKRVKGIEFLTASEFKIRLTGMEVGSVVLHYVDGSRQMIPLIYGRNIDCMTKPFATEVETLELNWLQSISAFTIPADPTRILESIEIRVYETDGGIGILGINLVGPESLNQ